MNLTCAYLDKHDNKHVCVDSFEMEHCIIWNAAGPAVERSVNSAILVQSSNHGESAVPSCHGDTRPNNNHVCRRQH